MVVRKGTRTAVTSSPRVRVAERGDDDGFPPGPDPHIGEDEGAGGGEDQVDALGGHRGQVVVGGGLLGKTAGGEEDIELDEETQKGQRNPRVEHGRHRALPHLGRGRTARDGDPRHRRGRREPGRKPDQTPKEAGRRAQDDPRRRLEEEVPPHSRETPGGNERTPADGQVDRHDHLRRHESHGQDREMQHVGDQGREDDPRQHQAAQLGGGHPRRFGSVDGEGSRAERDTRGDQRGDEEECEERGEAGEPLTVVAREQSEEEHRRDANGAGAGPEQQTPGGGGPGRLRGVPGAATQVNDEFHDRLSLVAEDRRTPFSHFWGNRRTPILSSAPAVRRGPRSFDLLGTHDRSVGRPLVRDPRPRC